MMINMREIKFRGQRTDTKEWVYGDIWSMGINRTGIHIQGLPYSDDCEHPDFSPIEVIPETVGQFIKRENNVDWYFGDILEYEGSSAYGWDNHKSILLLDEEDILKSGLGWLYDEDDDTAKSTRNRKIIGNKFENPEMIK